MAGSVPRSSHPTMSCSSDTAPCSRNFAVCALAVLECHWKFSRMVSVMKQYVLYFFFIFPIQHCISWKLFGLFSIELHYIPQTLYLHSIHSYSIHRFSSQLCKSYLTFRISCFVYYPKRGFIVVHKGSVSKQHYTTRALLQLCEFYCIKHSVLSIKEVLILVLSCSQHFSGTNYLSLPLVPGRFTAGPKQRKPTFFSNKHPVSIRN